MRAVVERSVIVVEEADIHIQLLSDLHIEVAGSHSAPSAAELDAGADIVVLASDVASAHDSVESTRLLCSAPHIGVIAGNNEFYRSGQGIDAGIAHMKAEAARFSEPGPQIHVLEDDQVMVDVRGTPVRVLGATLWVDFGLFSHVEESARVVTRGMNDFRLISGSAGRKLFTPRECWQRHRDSRRFLDGALAEPIDGPTIVVTHHLASGRCVSPQYVDDPFVGWFRIPIGAGNPAPQLSLNGGGSPNRRQ